MGLWSRLKRAVLGKPETVTRVVRAKYDAAQTNDDNRNHWRNVDKLSAKEANSLVVRKTLRERSRYEISNNGYAGGMGRTLANDLVGTGPRLQVTIPNNAEASKQVERLFKKWSKAVQLARKLRCMRVAKRTDGEAFAILIQNDTLNSPVKLDIRLIECDQVTTPAKSTFGPLEADGIKFDKFGNPLEYHVLKTHPGDQGATQEYDKIPAQFVLHWFRMDRPGQVRGIPETSAGLPLFSQLRRFTLATLTAAETAASFAALLYAPLQNSTEPIEDNAIGEAWDSIDIERGMMTTLPPGYQATQLSASHPNATHKDFKHETLNEAARNDQMPFNVATGNSSGYNYASGRLDHQTYHRAIDVERSEFESTILDRILEAWVDEAALAAGLPGGLPEIEEWDFEWFWDGFDHVDPTKEASAQQTRLASNTTTLADEYAKQGYDWREKLKQIAIERAEMARLKITPAAPAAPSDPSSKPGQEPDPDAADEDTEDAQTEDAASGKTNAA